MTRDNDLLQKQLEDEEDKRSCVYKDHLGYYTIGIGRLVDSRKGARGLRDVEIKFMLDNDVEELVGDINSMLPWFSKLDAVRQDVIIMMAFQMGLQGMLAFNTTLGFVKDGEYEEASKQMLKSRWAKQTPDRAKRMAEQMRTGIRQFKPGSKYANT